MPEPRLTREQDAELRRLLSQARHDEPMPDDVAQRLDRVLAGLRVEGAPAAPVADLGERRDASRARRRNATGLLVAAAAVLVVGVGIGQVVSRDDSSDDSSSASSAGVDRAGGDASGSPAAPTSDAPTGSPDFLSPTTPPDRSALSANVRAQLPVALSSTRLGSDVRRAAALAAQARLQPGAAAVSEPVPGWTCAGSFTVVGDADLLLPATYDGTPALLVLGPTDTGRQQARVLACGTFETVRRVLVGGS